MINQFLEIKVMQLAYELVDRYGLTKRQALEEIESAKLSKWALKLSVWTIEH